MNSQFKNSNFGSIVYISIIAIIAVGLIMISWYMVVGYKLGTYSEDTILGGIYIGGLSEDDIESRVIERTDRWFADETVVFELTYQGYRYEFDRTKFVFDLELSKDYLKDGETNELFAIYQSGGTDRADTIQEIMNLPFLADIKDNIQYEKLITDILSDASLMKTYSSKAVEDYLVDETLSVEDLASIDFYIPEGISVDALIQSVTSKYGEEYILLSSKELFDITSSLGENLNDAEMTIVSSAMLELSLATNFSIHEVHYNPVIDTSLYDMGTYPYFGRNANVNKVVGNSFSVYNPNDSDYKFRIEKVDESTAKLVLVGLPFVNTITVEKVMTDIGYITQNTDDDSLLQAGREGKIVIVERVIYDLNENKVYEKDIIFEFYPPVIEIALEPTAE